MSLRQVIVRRSEDRKRVVVIDAGECRCIEVTSQVGNKTKGNQVKITDSEDEAMTFLRTG